MKKRLHSKMHYVYLSAERYVYCCGSDSDYRPKIGY